MRCTLVLNGVAKDEWVENVEPNPDGPTTYKPVIAGYTLTPAFDVNNFLVWVMEPE